MPVSHLTLTVSHLPTSTSFFLSCLQPLGYKFIGRHDEYIGFGSKADEPADFWLAQEQPGTPAGAAHIAFPAPTKEAVNTFFISALKAGGKIHGEPKLRDPETGYFSAAVVDFDGNSIEAVYRPDQTTTNIKNGSSVVSSRARSIRTTTETRAVVQTAIENIPPARVKMLDQQPQPQLQQAYQQSYAPTQQQSDNGGNGISAKTIIGTLLGATAGAALAYAMIKGDSTSASSQTNSQSSPSPAPAPSQYAQQQLPPQQPPQQPQPHQMSMSLPMLMPMLGPYQDQQQQQQQQQQQPVYRALEAPPPPSMAASQAARSTYTANDAISAYTRSTAPNKSKSPRADTIYEETEYYPPITDDGIARSLYSQESSSNAASGTGTGSGVRRTSNGSIYATRELPIRAIEYSSSEMMSVASSQNSQSSQAKVRSQSYPCDPSTFISSFAETQQQYQNNRHQQQGRIIGEAESDFSSISTIKPAKSVSLSAHRSVASSQHPRSSKSSTTSKHSSHRHEDIDNNNNNNGSTTSSSTARKLALPDSRPGSTYTYTSSTSKRSSISNTSTIKDIKRDIDAYEIPLPASVAAPSTVFLDAVVDIAPEDSISQVGINHHNKSSSGRSHRSRSGPSSAQQQSHVSVSSSTSASKREKKEGSKFDQPVRPSDSISQVSSNHSHRQHHSSSHSSHHSGSHKASSRVSGTPSKKSHSGGSRSGIY